MRLSVWPRSLFGRLLATAVLALLFAQAASLVLVARERENFILQNTVREWSRRIGEIAVVLQGMDRGERDSAVAQLEDRPRHYSRRFAESPAFRDRMLGGPEPERAGRDPLIVPFSITGDMATLLRQQLLATLGAGFDVSVVHTADPARRAIPVNGGPFAEARSLESEQYDANVRLPDGYSVPFRVTRLLRGAPLPRGLFVNLTLLLAVMVVALFVAARSITRPLSQLAQAADRVGRDLRQPRLEERGARELRDAARAFNTMQDRLQRFLDSRTRVLAAMSHDLKTPLTRLRLQVEMLEDPAGKARIGPQLDEMEALVNGALALFRGLDDDEAYAAVDINALLTTLQSEFAEMSAPVTIAGRALRPIHGKPLALRRCLTNLIANAVKFGTRATVLVEDGASLILRIRDEGPGIPAEELEKVFEPFYRLESSRNRDTGGTGLGLSIARDVVQAHGGTIVLNNLPVRGLEAIVRIPRT